MCLSGSPVFPANLSCVSVGLLSGNATTSVCASILSFLKSHCVRRFESVSGPLLEEGCDAMSRFTVLWEMTEDMLWDEVGIVADEAYRQESTDGWDFNERKDAASEKTVAELCILLKYLVPEIVFHLSQW